MNNFIKRFPLHPFLFTMYPVLALFAFNIKEVESSVVIRPLLVSLCLAGLILVILGFLFRNFQKASALTTLLLVLFFSYGHFYTFAHSTWGTSIGRHRYLVIIYLFLLVIGVWLILRKRGNFSKLTSSLNLLCALLLIFPALQIGRHFLTVSTSQKIPDQMIANAPALMVNAVEPLPDVYYIVLDMYTRADSLKKDFGFDNSSFINDLQQLGFYVADCSRSNYSYTQGSLATALNLNYLPALFDTIRSYGLSDKDIWVLIKQSLVRRQLEAIGYQTVAFQTDYEWSRISDADILLSLGNVTANSQVIKPFESMLIRSTALLFLSDGLKNKAYSDLNISNHPFADHINLQLFTLDQLPNVPSIPGPKFVFVHILIPHVPYVFDAKGGILTDPGFFSAANSMPVNEDYLQKGYVGQIQFINDRMLSIFARILAESQTPPVIVIHGDHGVRDENRLQILNAYYLSAQGQAQLYPAISPVNSFRVVFNTYFGTSYHLLPDESYLTDDAAGPSPETSPACLGQ